MKISGILSAASAFPRSRATLCLVGWCSVLLGLVGLWYHLTGLPVGNAEIKAPPYFLQTYYTMAAVNIALLLAGIVVGAQLARGQVQWIVPFVIIEFLIVVDIVFPVVLTRNPHFGLAVAAAYGISRGTSFQALILFPIWGSLSGLWAAGRLSTRDTAPLGIGRSRAAPGARSSQALR